MLLGIDVGGTYTDAVLVEDGRLVRQSKTLTESGLVLQSILTALDSLLTGISPGTVTRVALSTTLVTNAIVQGNIDPVGLFILPGPGADWRGRIPGEPIMLAGTVDHRGRVRQETDLEVVRQSCRNRKGLELYAVSGNKTVRNASEENRVAGEIQNETHPLHVTCGAAVCGRLNFVRRTNSAYFNAAVWKRFKDFADGAEEAMGRRGIAAPIFILKADGGTLPLATARRLPVESIFTGPAASVLGVMALCLPQVPAVSIDIGGTTTDIALWKNGAPLADVHGAQIAGFLTAVRTFRLRSIGLGGDSWVRRESGSLVIGPQRLGAAMAVGGPAPTVTDALVVAGLCSLGERGLAEEGIRQVSLPGNSLTATALEIVEQAGAAICEAIKEISVRPMM